MCIIFVLQNMNCNSSKLECVNTPKWDGRYPGQDCRRYEGYCENGYANKRYAFLMTDAYNNPDENCCACGKVREGI